ncbi:MAG: energy-coupling factor ABC transporter ATP-binding protein [Actinomycetota bacterium]
MRTALKIDRLSYKYHSSNRLDLDGAPLKQILKNITFHARKEEKLSIIGPNGAGKSTLLLNIAGLAEDKHREGNIQVFGKDINKANIFDIREDIGFVFQDPNDQLFSARVFDDVAFGLINFLTKKNPKKARDRSYIEQVVKLTLGNVNMDGVEDMVPHFLSFGEKKLVALATVLSYSPRILILDEPTSNLDPANRRNLTKLIKSMKKTIIIATHDLDLAYEFSERCIIINQGEIVFDGSTREILTDERFLLNHNLDLPLRFKR